MRMLWCKKQQKVNLIILALKERIGIALFCSLVSKRYMKQRMRQPIVIISLLSESLWGQKCQYQAQRGWSLLSLSVKLWSLKHQYQWEHEFIQIDWKIVPSVWCVRCVRCVLRITPTPLAVGGNEKRSLIGIRDVTRGRKLMLVPH